MLIAENVEVKPKLIREQHEQYEYQAQLSGAKVYFNDPSMTYEHLMMFEKDGHNIVLSLNNASPEAHEVFEDEINYINVLPGVDVNYKLLQDRVKEDIIIKSASSPHLFDFMINQECVSVVANEDDSFTYLNEKGMPVWTVEAPYAYDATGKELEVDVVYTEGVAYSYEVLIDGSEVYPITLDPTLIAASDTSALQYNGHHIAVAPDGTIYSASKITPSTTYAIFKSTDNGLSWESISLPQSASTYSKTGMSMAVDSQNNLYVVMAQTHITETKSQIWIYKYDGTSWDASGYNTGNINGYHQYQPDIAIDSTDKIHIVWAGCEASYPTYYQIKYATSTTDWHTFTVPANIYVDNTAYQMMPNMFIDKNDNVHVVSTNGTNTTTAGYYNRKISGGAWIKVSIAGNGYQKFDFKIVVNTRGHAYVFTSSYHASSTANYQILCNIFNGVSFAGWNIVGFTSAKNQYSPNPALDENDDIIVTWYGYNNSLSYPEIRYAKYTTAWSAAATIVYVSAKFHIYPDIAVRRTITNKFAINFIMYSSYYTYFDDSISGFDSTQGYVQTTVPTTATKDTNQRKTVKDSLGNYYTVFIRGDQVECYKSTDLIHWINMSFPLTTGYVQQTPSIAIDALDNLHVTWAGKHSGNVTYDKIKYTMFNGSVWSSIEVLPIQDSTVTLNISSYNQLYPSITVDSNNKVHIVWAGTDSYNTSYAKIKYASRPQSGSWSNWYLIGFTASNLYTQYNPQITIDSLDNLHVVWSGTDTVNTTNPQLKYTKSINGGVAWSAWANILPDTYNQLYPSIAIDSEDNLHVAYQGYDSVNTATYQVKYTKFDGAIWSAWTSVSDITSYAQNYAQIGVDSNNHLHVTWLGMDATYTARNQVKYSKFDGTSWSAWANINPDAVNNQFFPMILEKMTNKLLIIYGLGLNLMCYSSDLITEVIIVVNTSLDLIRRILVDSSTSLDTIRKTSVESSTNLDTERKVSIGSSTSVDSIRRIYVDANTNLDTLRKAYIEASAILDTLRIITADINANVNLDTLRRVYVSSSANLDTIRKTVINADSNLDTLRRSFINANTNLDTIRKLSINSNANLDVLRKLSVDASSKCDTLRGISVEAATQMDTLRPLYVNASTLMDTLRQITNGIRASVNLDTLRRVYVDANANLDTIRKLSIDSYTHVDTIRRISLQANTNMDTFRKVKALANVSMDTRRPLMVSANTSMDTVRRISIRSSASMDTIKKTLINASAHMDTKRTIIRVSGKDHTEYFTVSYNTPEEMNVAINQAASFIATFNSPEIKKLNMEMSEELIVTFSQDQDFNIKI